MALIPDTQGKLREARLFLNKLIEEDGVLLPPAETSETFLHHLSAFLSAARSVTYVLQAEQKHLYDAWFDSWKDSLPDKGALLRFFNNQRIQEIHRTGAGVTSTIEDVPATKFAPKPGDFPAGIHISAPPGTPITTVEQTVLFFEIDGALEEVPHACGRYLAILARLVTEFEAAHSTSAKTGVETCPNSGG